LFFGFAFSPFLVFDAFRSWLSVQEFIWFVVLELKTTDFSLWQYFGVVGNSCNFRALSESRTSWSFNSEHFGNFCFWKLSKFCEFWSPKNESL